MKDIYLVNYSVKGIKTLDEIITLSFYKKIISNDIDTQDYNIKGIYGMNGSGKSGIVMSVDILRNILINPGYLNNSIVQKNLNEIINKKSEELLIEVEYIVKVSDELRSFKYELILSKNNTGKYVIAYERLTSKKTTSKRAAWEMIFKVKNGEIISIAEKEDNGFLEIVFQKTINLLETNSMCALFCEKILLITYKKNREMLSDSRFFAMASLFIFGKKLHVYLDKSDDHREYFIQNSLKCKENNSSNIESLVEQLFKMDAECLNDISVNGNMVYKDSYDDFKKTVDNLYEFLHIFKSDLQRIDIDKKEDHNIFVCDLIMVYDSYRINVEFESTGIKKLIKLFTYLREMVQGGIVFIDELDSNLHDVYLCALLEYLMEYGEGQLCFTTHNVGPMDVLKHHKKSIEFLSEDHKIYPWTTNGNYSPSKLYRNGMIEGSPFNVESIDFIRAFGISEEDD